MTTQNKREIMPFNVHIQTLSIRIKSKWKGRINSIAKRKRKESWVWAKEKGRKRVEESKKKVSRKIKDKFRLKNNLRITKGVIPRLDTKRWVNWILQICFENFESRKLQLEKLYEKWWSSEQINTQQNKLQEFKKCWKEKMKMW